MAAAAQTSPAQLPRQRAALPPIDAVTLDEAAPVLGRSGL
jgi:hypothetical protein